MNFKLCTLKLSLFFTLFPFLIFSQVSGEIDLSFDPGNNTTNMGIVSTALQSDGKVIVVGEFTTINGIPSNGIARLNPDGSLDNSFNIGEGAEFGFVFSVAVQPNGKILIGGTFQSFNGSAVSNLARLNEDGTIDATFNVGGGGMGPNGNVSTLRLFDDERILIAGDFTVYNSIPRNQKIAVLYPDGALYETFNPGSGSNNASPSDAVIQSDGKILVSASISSWVFNSLPAKSIIRLNEDGSLDNSFDIGTTGASGGSVKCLAFQNDGKILAGGDFSSFNGNTNLHSLIRLNPDGSDDFLFNPPTSGFVLPIHTLKILANGKILAGGSFGSYNGVSHLAGIVRLEANGDLDNSFHAGNNTAIINSIQVQSNEKIIIAGSFSNFFGRKNIARLYGTCQETYSYFTITECGSYELNGSEYFSSGVYYQYFSNAYGCDSILELDLTILDFPVFTIVGEDAYCEGEEIILIASGDAISYDWSNGVENGIPFIPFGFGNLNYFLTVTGSNGCIVEEEATITVYESPIVDAGFDIVVCQGEPVTLSASGNAVTYIWLDGVNDGVPFVPNFTYMYALEGISAEGCINESYVWVTVNQLPSVNAGEDVIVCEGDEIILTATGTASSYFWSEGVENGIPFVPQNVGSTIIYYVNAIDENGCLGYDELFLTVNPSPVVNAGNDVIVCEGEEITLQASGNGTVSWSNGVVDGEPFVPLQTNFYTATIEDLGCISSDVVLITVNPNPTITSVSNNEICNSGSLVLGAVADFGTVQWFSQAIGGDILALGNGFLTPVINQTTSYFVASTFNDCSSDRVEVVATIHQAPLVELNISNSSCSENNGQVSVDILSENAPFEFYWNNGVQNQTTISNLAPGIYYFNIEDANGCKAVYVADVAPLGISIVPTVNNVSCFGGSDGSVSIQVAGMTGELSYSWNTGNNSATLSNLIAGNYDVRVQNDAGCVITGNYRINQPEKLSTSVAIIAPSCGNNDGELNVIETTGGTGAYSYSWSNGQNGQTASNIPFGVYSLTTMDQEACMTINTIYVSEDGAPGLNGQIIPASCNTNDGAINVTPELADGQTIQSISWSNGATTQSIANIEAGNFVCTAVSSANCTAVRGWNVPIVAPDLHEICIVTVDSLTTTNLVVWEKVQETGISHYNIYRETSVFDEYMLVGIVDFDSLSVYNDVVASPKVRSWRYKIAAVNFCNEVGPISSNHKTLHLVSTPLDQESVLVAWDKYEGTSYANYELWRHTEESDWEMITELPANQTNYQDNIDPTTPGLDYMLEIILEDVCTATWRAQDFNVSRSNREKGIFNPEGVEEPNSIQEFTFDNIHVILYPNPNDGDFYLEHSGKQNLNYSIIDLTGKIIAKGIFNQKNNHVKIDGIADGMYNLKVENEKSSKVIRFVVAK
jgi:uncharacterized delta-60 repeat protein